MSELKLIDMAQESDIYRLSINPSIMKVNLSDSKILQQLNLMAKKVAS